MAGGRITEWVGAHVRRGGRDRGRAARAAHRSRRAHRLLDRGDDDDRRRQLRRVHATPAGQPADHDRAIAHVRDAVDRTDPRRLRRASAPTRAAVRRLPAADRAPRSARRRRARARRRVGKSAGTSGTRSCTSGHAEHTTAEIVAAGVRAAHPGRAGAQRRERHRAASSSSPAVCTSTTRRARSRCRRGRGASTTRIRRRRARRRASASTPAAIEPRVPARPASRRPSAGLPLDGVRVLDLTAWWAGPVAAAMLAALGADVIHVESTSRPDGMRMTGAVLGMDGPWWERSDPLPLREHQQARPHARSDRSRAGSTLLQRLIAESDVLIENFTPRVHGATSGSSWDDDPRASTRAASSCACRRSGCPVRGATTPASRRRWSRSPGWRGSPATRGTSRGSNVARAIRTPGMHAAFAMLVGARRARRHRPRDVTSR